MSSFDLDKLVRKNVAQLKAYSSARDEFEGKADVFLDANENPFTSDFNRYPDPTANLLRQELAKAKGLSADQIFIGNGSDEAIDLLMRAFAVPGKDKIAQLSPTYGMYQVSAAINDLDLLEIPLNQEFDLDSGKTLKSLEAENPKILFVCSPNNPTGNNMNAESVEEVLRNFSGLVVVDEAYADFSEMASWLDRLSEFPNLVVLQTFSKARGLAALRVGMAYASAEIIAILNRIKPPYNVNVFSQKKALEALIADELSTTVKMLVEERSALKSFLERNSLVRKVYPSEANFFLVEFKQASKVFDRLKEAGIIVRDRQKAVSNCLRITVGTQAENELLKNELLRIEQELKV